MSVVGRNFVAAPNMQPVNVDVTTVIRGVFILPKLKYKTKVYMIVIRIRLVHLKRIRWEKHKGIIYREGH